MKIFNRLCGGAVVFVALLLFCKSGAAQIVNYDTFLDKFASAYVSSLDEFIQRFNAEEFHPDLNRDIDSNLRERSILTLFNWQKYHVQDSCDRNQIIIFTNFVSKNNIFLDMEREGLYAEANCLFTYQTQEIPINLIFVFENIRDDYYKWAVKGANGLIESNLVDTIHEGYISPVQHELHFSELSSACIDLNSYFSIDKSVDQLSFVLGMIKTGQLKFVSCNKVVFHFSQVPGYIFVVEKINRMDNNSGYLINSLICIDDLDKQSYIKKLLGEI